MIRIQITTRNRSPRIESLSKMRMTVGRSPRSDLPIDDPFASRLHAELRRVGDGVWVSDMGSANGTRVNNAIIDGSVVLAPGDQIQIGETTLDLLEATGDRRDGMERTDTLTAARILGPTASSPALETVLANVERAAGRGEEPRTYDRPDLLEVIGRVGVALLSSASLEQVLERIVDLIFDALPVERAFVLLRDDDSAPRVIAARSRGTTGVETGDVPLSQSVVQEVLGNGRAVLTSDAQQDQRFRDRESVVLSGLRSLMAVPLATGGETFGMISVDSPLRVRLFDEADLELLTTIASVAAVKVENVLLLEEHIENESLREQLSSARDIQLRLLPAGPPEIAAYDITGVSFPCFEVGGDYFDFIPVNGNLVLALADVSGKGLDAALTMSSLHASVRAQAESGATLEELTCRVNDYLARSTPFNRFATLFCARLDPSSHRLEYSNAGNCPAILVGAEGNVRQLTATSMPVGMLPGIDARSETLDLGRGDLLVVFSDGLNEAENPEGEEFGLERLTEVLCAARTLSTPSVRDRIDEALIEFTGKGAPADDLTLIVLKRVE